MTVFVSFHRFSVGTPTVIGSLQVILHRTVSVLVSLQSVLMKTVAGKASLWIVQAKTAGGIEWCSSPHFPAHWLMVFNLFAVLQGLCNSCRISQEIIKSEGLLERL